MEPQDELKAMGLIRKALAPLLREELLEKVAAEVTKQLAPELEKVLSHIRVEVDTKALDTHIQEFLSKRDTHIRYEPKIELAVPELAKVAEVLKAANTVSDYRPHDQDAPDGSLYAYYGFMHPSGDWYIMRSSSTDQRYVGGSGGYGEAWDKRTKQSYGLIDEAFNE